MDHVILYVTEDCNACDAARQLLESTGIDAYIVDVTGDAVKRKWLHEKTGSTDLPQCSVGSRWIGGYDEMLNSDLFD